MSVVAKEKYSSMLCEKPMSTNAVRYGDNARQGIYYNISLC